MEWERWWYMDIILVPLGLSICIGYHIFLWYKVRTSPFSTVNACNACAREFWVLRIFKDNEKKNILAVQTLRNTIMGSTVMATTSILLCTGLAAVLSSTYSIKKPLNDSNFLGIHGEFAVSLKYVVLLLFVLSAFFCYSLAIRFFNQVNFLINCPPDAGVTPEYVAELLERGCTMNTVGNRVLYVGLPLLLWIFGPVLVFLGHVAMVPVLYNMDFVFDGKKPENGCPLSPV